MKSILFTHPIVIPNPPPPPNPNPPPPPPTHTHTPKLSPHRKLCIFTFSTKKTLRVLISLISLGGKNTHTHTCMLGFHVLLYKCNGFHTVQTVFLYPVTLTIPHKPTPHTKLSAILDLKIKHSFCIYKYKLFFPWRPNKCPHKDKNFVY